MGKKKIVLVKNDKITNDNTDVCDTLNAFFVNVAKESQGVKCLTPWNSIYRITFGGGGASGCIFWVIVNRRWHCY